MLTTYWFYLTPVFLALRRARRQQHQLDLHHHSIQSMYHFISCFRQMVTGSRPPLRFRHRRRAWSLRFFAVVTFAVGLFTFKKLEEIHSLHLNEERKCPKTHETKSSSMLRTCRLYSTSRMKIQSLKEYFIKIARHELMFREFIAVDNVSFQVERGDVFGLVGNKRIR